MRRVITISLNGNAYQLDEGGFEALRAYLDGAEARLRDNPDKAEVIADLEQAIAEKCGRFISPHKTVVSAEEIARVIQEMGPVDGADAEAGAAPEEQAQSRGQGARTDSSTTKRLYQIRAGAMISGVCNGFAAYFGVDVTLVRVIFIILTILTGGLWSVAYIVMMFVIPYANTSEDHAAAHGWPFTAQELIDRAKQHYAQFKDGSGWRWQWRQQRRIWRLQRRQWRAQSRSWRQWDGVTQQPPAPWLNGRPEDTGYAVNVLAAIVMPVAMILHAALVLAFVLVLWSLVTKHAVLGWSLPPDTHLWEIFIVLIVVYSVIAAPLRAARIVPYLSGRYGNNGSVLMIWAVLVWFAFVGVIGWWSWNHWPQLHHYFDLVAAAL
jgi:phage shock protein PspC (stress-responsive transcriptional regulator)